MNLSSISRILILSLCPVVTHAHPHPGVAPGAAASAQAVTGNGAHTFATDPDWGGFPDGKPVGPTHGGIAIGKSGDIFVSTDGDRSICVFGKDGAFRRSIAPDCAGTHSLTIREEDGVEFLYGAHLRGQRIVKLTLDGKLALEIKDGEDQPIPGGLKGVTAVAVAPDGTIFAAVGYGSNLIHAFDPAGKLLRSFGARGKGDDQFRTCHGLAIDSRFDPPMLLVADRENRRLMHYGLDGKPVGKFAGNLRRPCAVSFHGEFCAVAELEGRVTILDKSGTPVAFLGDNPDRKQWANFKTPLEEIPTAIFTAPHGLSYDANGDLCVQDWNSTGRITRLVRVIR